MRVRAVVAIVVVVASAVAVATQQAPSPQPRTLVWVDRAGVEQALGAPARLYSNPRISPDGRRLAITAGEPNAEHIWVCDLPACGNLTQFTTQGTTNDIATWTPDGRRLAFYSNMQAGPAAAYWQMADGSGMPERLTPPIPVAQHLRAFSPNGQIGVMYHATPATGPDIWLLRLNDRTEFPFLATPAVEGGARYSPDGNWLAYMSTESGGAQIYVQELPGERRKKQVSTQGGVQPIWHPKGGEVYYREERGRVMAVSVTTAPTLSVGQPRVVVDRQYWTTPVGLTNQSYDLSPDGQRFLMLKEAAAPRTN
jgi:serine/threonine-protein kinase